MSEHSSNRLGCVDGVRGYLAMFVCVHHFVIYYWAAPLPFNDQARSFFHSMGQSGVAIFFMITGFLFFHRVLQNPDINWGRFFVSRFFRIYPLFLFSLLLISLLSFRAMNYETDTTWVEWVKNIASWLLFVGGDINGFDAQSVNLGVQWTLKYEWAFYLALPLLAAVVHKSRILTWLTIVSVILLAFFPLDVVLYTGFYILFLLGGFTAWLSLSDMPVKRALKSNTMAVAGLSALLAQMVFFHTAYGVVQSLLLALFFIPLAIGNDYFGLLRLRTSIFLGKISYSIYLLHGIVLFVLYTIWMPHLLEVESIIAFFAFLAATLSLIALVAWATYSLIEVPFLEYGRRLQTSSVYTKDAEHFSPHS